MSATTKTKIIRDGKVRWATTTKSDVPNVEIADPTGIADFSKPRTKHVNECVYCGSTLQLSREHIIAYALGGTTTIPDGSCENCRTITQKFETAVLRGPMQMVRYIQGMPSGTKHKDVPENIPVIVFIKDKKVKMDVPREDAPILLPFPIFELPAYLERDISSELRLTGWITSNFGVDANEFCKKQGAERLELIVNRIDAIAFARLVAKTAYTYASAQDQLQRLKNRHEFVQAMLREPNTIGRFVGTAPEPYKTYSGVQHRLSIHIMPEYRLLYSTVQLFASAGAPNYIVVLGELRDDDPMNDAE